MKVHRLTCRQFIPMSLADAWAYFSTPHNLEAITPDFLRFEITSEMPAEIYSGLIITYRIAAVAAIPLTWVTEIKAVRPLAQFVDEQRFGPFRFWHHLHRFRVVVGGTEMEDVVHYVMPWGSVGCAIHGLFIRKRLETIFDYRRQVIANRFGAAAH